MITTVTVIIEVTVVTVITTVSVVTMVTIVAHILILVNFPPFFLHDKSYSVIIKGVSTSRHVVEVCTCNELFNSILGYKYNRVLK